MGMHVDKYHKDSGTCALARSNWVLSHTLTSILIDKAWSRVYMDMCTIPRGTTGAG